MSVLWDPTYSTSMLLYSWVLTETKPELFEITKGYATAIWTKCSFF